MITVLTPTFNRAQLLHRLFESLKKQDDQSFEWLIIDDGSTDETKDLFDRDLPDASFEKRYIHKPNGGKHSALNIGFKEAKYDWVFVVDSDDWLKPDSISSIKSELKNMMFPEFGALSVLKLTPEGSVVGDEFPDHLKSYIDRLKFNIEGDKADVIHKKALEDFQFPVFEGEKFLAEDPMFLWIGNKFKTKFSNLKVYVCDYQPDGLSSSSARQRHQSYQSSLYVYEKRYNSIEIKKIKYKAAINWWRFRLGKNYKKHSQVPIFFLPFGATLFFLDKLKGHV